MFILVSLPLGLVTGGLSGPPWSAFWFLQIGRNFGIYNVHYVQMEEIKKSKKATQVNLPCFIRKVNLSAGLA